MIRLAKLRQAAKPIRDFICSLIVFSCLFAAMSPVEPAYAPLPVLSLITEWDSAVWGSTSDVTPRSAAFATQDAGTSLSGNEAPLISSVLALVFASMMTFSLGLMRYLGRANASPRRGAWRGF